MAALPASWGAEERGGNVTEMSRVSPVLTPTRPSTRPGMNLPSSSGTVMPSPPATLGRGSPLSPSAVARKPFMLTTSCMPVAAASSTSTTSANCLRSFRSDASYASWLNSSRSTSTERPLYISSLSSTLGITSTSTVKESSSPTVYRLATFSISSGSRASPTVWMRWPTPLCCMPASMICSTVASLTFCMPSLAMTACGGTLPSRNPGTLAFFASRASVFRWISFATFFGTTMSSAIADLGSIRTSHLSVSFASSASATSIERARQRGTTVACDGASAAGRAVQE